MYVIITKEELLDRNLFVEAVEIKGMDIYGVQQMPHDEEISLTEKQATEIGLIIGV